MLLIYPQIEVDTTRRHGQILYDDVTVRTPFSVVLTLLLCCQGVEREHIKLLTNLRATI